jgi:hypothetical protein
MLFAVPQIGTGSAPLADPLESPDNGTPAIQQLPTDEAVPREEKLPEKNLSSQISQTKSDDMRVAREDKSKSKPALAKTVANSESKIANAVMEPIRPKALTSVSPAAPAEAQAADNRSCRRLASDEVLP